MASILGRPGSRVKMFAGLLNVYPCNLLSFPHAFHALNGLCKVTDAARGGEKQLFQLRWLNILPTSVVMASSGNIFKQMLEISLNRDEAYGLP